MLSVLRHSRLSSESCPSVKPIPGACNILPTSRLPPIFRPKTATPGSGIRRTAGSMTSSRWRCSQNLDAGPHGTPPPHFPVFSKPIVNLKGMGVGSRVLQSASRLRAALRARPFLDDAARRPARLVRHRRGRGRAVLVASRHRQAGGRGHVRLLDRACRAGSRDRSGVAAIGSKAISPAIRACSISKPSAARSSRRICALPISGPIFTVRAGSMRWSGFTRATNGTFTTTTAAKATASCCSGRPADAAGIRRRR